MIKFDFDKTFPDSIDSAFVDISDGGGKIAVGVVYHPPGEDLSVFNNGYCNLLDKLSRRKTRCYITGDYNISLLNCDTHVETDQLLDNAFLHYCFPVITRPTRYCSSTSTLSDNIFTNGPVNNSPCRHYYF